MNTERRKLQWSGASSSRACASTRAWWCWWACAGVPMMVDVMFVGTWRHDADDNRRVKVVRLAVATRAPGHRSRPNIRPTYLWLQVTWAVLVHLVHKKHRLARPAISLFPFTPRGLDPRLEIKFHSRSSSTALDFSRGNLSHNFKEADEKKISFRSDISISKTG